MRGNSVYLRRLISRQVSSLGSANAVETLASPSKAAARSSNSIIPRRPYSCNYVSSICSEKFQSSRNSLQFQRRFCSSTDDPQTIVLIKSEEEFNRSISKMKDESLPAIFYFTAAWCGPCKFISPVIEDLSVKYPHVTTYKIDIDQEGLRSTLANLNIAAVPTLYFYKNGGKVSEIVGADVATLKDTMEKLYKQG